MNDRPPRDKTPSEPGKTSPGSLLDNFMKGEILILLPRQPTPERIVEKMDGSRARFAPNALMTMNAELVEFLTDQTRDQLKKSFMEFRQAGGTLIIIITQDQVMATLFRNIAAHSRIAIKIVGSLEEVKPLRVQHFAPKTP